mmetsp:Transcript_21701/g.38147  ORF Transcript_21701/g.38147 Transcript_21701/m.38147 type:complete len:226 (-) Transcript_21701:91-768(-)
MRMSIFMIPWALPLCNGVRIDVSQEALDNTDEAHPQLMDAAKKMTAFQKRLEEFGKGALSDRGPPPERDKEVSPKERIYAKLGAALSAVGGPSAEVDKEKNDPSTGEPIDGHQAEQKQSSGPHFPSLQECKATRVPSTGLCRDDGESCLRKGCPCSTSKNQGCMIPFHCVYLDEHPAKTVWKKEWDDDVPFLQGRCCAVRMVDDDPHGEIAGAEDFSVEKNCSVE